jgi:hypothetical protein
MSHETWNAGIDLYRTYTRASRLTVAADDWRPAAH